MPGGNSGPCLSQSWLDFADQECAGYSPLYDAVCRAVAADPELLALTAAAPPSGQQPNVLLAAAHYLLLGGDAHPLAAVYAGNADPAAAPALFRDLCLSRRDEVARLLATRYTQTNEPGRAAVLGAGLAAATALVGARVGLLDAGCSAGLNLLLDHYRFEYGPPGALGPPDSPVRIDCELRGTGTAPARLPEIAARLGLDRAPVDLGDGDDVRWLLACVWPDTGRLPRTTAAVELGRRYRPTLRRGDMVDGLDAALDAFDPELPVVVITSSACGYLEPDRRRAFLDVLARRSRYRPLAWLSAEMPGVVGPVPTPPGTDFCNLLGLVTFDGAGTPTGRLLGRCHPHGRWLDWLGQP